jgi:tRNA U34 2-thiouridine synthase MnmA/TrmU
MASDKRKIHALGLISGGLDSTLAAAVLLEQGIEVTGVNFHTGFCTLDHKRLMKNISQAKLVNPALKTEKKLQFPVELVDIKDEFQRLVTHPRYGYGKNANPCIDCRIMMLSKAKALMTEFDADFIFTGEVLGQRPMTQMRPTLQMVEKRSGLKGYLLRPLSALHLPPTIPELEGWVDRSKLKDFHGRGRKAQLAYAEEIGLEEIPTPAGGCCFLTDPGYSRKFFDLLDHRIERQATIDDFTLLKVGRHLRVKNDLKAIVGRNEGENEFLRRFTPDWISFEVEDFMGPLTLLEGADSEENRQICAQITARYSDAPKYSPVQVKVLTKTGENNIEVTPIESAVTDMWVIK